MLYVKIENGKAVAAIEGEISEADYRKVECRRDWHTLDVATARAAELSEATGELYIATDAGPHVYPQYDVIRPPQVGDEVSYSFNGDSYPCGKVAAVSKSLRRVVTDTGRVFYRRRQSGSWVNNGTWSLVPGHITERNPSF